MYPDIICFSHLRWNFVYQRPQHLLSRFARLGRVYYIEEAVFDAAPGAGYYHITNDPVLNLSVIEPHIEPGLSGREMVAVQRQLLDNFKNEQHIDAFIAWYYSPMAMTFSSHLHPQVTLYDCMDELSAFLNAPPAIKEQENLLMQRADLVFTGGKSLYEAKKHLHPHIYPFPSSIDHAHFSKAREPLAEPADQSSIPHPRIGFYGVIDERLHISLLRRLAQHRPNWHFILIGPTVKIDPATLPRADNLHYLGGKQYLELPAYLSGWDIAMLPFAHNEATRFISPTKTPEYLAGGKPVISTSIRDVVDPYEQLGLVEIADTTDEFIARAEALLSQTDNSAWLAKADEFLAHTSWDKTWLEMRSLMEPLLSNKINNRKKEEANV
ncbi:glycosyltransferase family 1 protein [Paraflavitalea sp. CAU 1676]|uniref:glycosyltransferase family 1 protein n=1 Tax=Paraflavitalea sp. CAU 1676 TaxID=3032598 RepID=UPI0023DB39D6|nr:glycosyltransferase family 1 protein [Paraflavitalea sp. CAU 1676]MDF2191214.1 glycosyltransferase family 1 protein [Paraflavitalea sp. CAU 1676]